MLKEQTEKIKRVCLSFGADLVGIADMSGYVGSTFTEILPFGISIGVKLDDDIIDKLEEGPTVEYAEHYRAVNKKLDEIAEKVASYIRELGFRANVIPASKIVDEKNLLGHISHKAVARLAGLGWQGKSLLIVNKEIGPRFRLVTVLTDFPLLPDKPVKNECRGCILCTKYCPAKAIKNVNTEDYYKDREIAIDLNRCYEKLLYFKSLEGINATVCGICVKVCPYGLKKRRKEK